MNCNLPKITYPTFRTLLLLKICEAIYHKTDVQVANDAIADLKTPPELPNPVLFQQRSILKKVKNPTSVAVYRSSIALQLAPESPQTRQEMAYQIVHSFQSLLFNSSRMEIERLLLRDLTVSTTEAGQLEFEFGDLAIANWLQVVLQHCRIQPPLVSDSNSAFSTSHGLSENPQIFLCQYSYARCAAILRLIDLSNFMGQTVETAIWTRDGQLLLSRERTLTAQIVETLDGWEQESSLKLAIALSQVFQTFYRDCQIVKYDTVDRQIAQCRLALVMITHWLLEQLLEQGLGVLAPKTL